MVELRRRHEMMPCRRTNFHMETFLEINQLFVSGFFLLLFFFKINTSFPKSLQGTHRTVIPTQTPTNSQRDEETDVLLLK